MKGYYKIRKKAIDILRTQIPENHYYHSIYHTLDTLKVCNQSIKREKIDPHNALLLRIAVLYHDVGFSVSNINHEFHSIQIVKKIMKEQHFSKSDILIVSNLILSTKNSEEPKNQLEEILCDADLDYLGRSDFYTLSHLLYKELRSFSIIKNENEWDKVQIEFLENHKYYTTFSIKNRQPKVLRRIAELKKIVTKKY